MPPAAVLFAARAAAVGALPADICAPVGGVNCYGGDISYTSAVTSAAACCAACQQTAGCVAWTWNGVANGRCYAKTGCADPRPGADQTSGAAAAIPTPPPAPPAPPQLPSYPPVYQMNLSTIIMPCNSAGPTDPASTMGWGVVDFDWSNWKGTGASDGWAKAKPMDCEERLARQVQLTTAASPSTKVWVYRNSILALPWYTSVRVKLEDPAYGFWFLNFSSPPPAIHQQGNANTTCDNTFSPPKCSNHFHDSVQTPGYPHGDGDCAAPGCDVGETLPIGAYLFNPAAANTSVNGQTFTEWFIDDYLFGPNGGGNPNISGFFFDDQFNPTGATESQGNLANLGLTKEEGAQYSQYYWEYMKQVYTEVVKRGKFAWQLMWTGQPECWGSYGCLGTTGTHHLVSKASCASDLRRLCNETSQAQTRAMMFPFNGSPGSLPEFKQDLANFLLVRGKYAWLGHAWNGCSHDYLFPDELNADYGEPSGVCKESSPNVFTREWSKASIKMDCSTYTGTIDMKS